MLHVYLQSGYVTTSYNNTSRDVCESFYWFVLEARAISVANRKWESERLLWQNVNFFFDFKLLLSFIVHFFIIECIF